LRALDDLIRQGKVRYVGCSNFPAWQVADALAAADRRNLSPFVSCQDEYSLLVRGAERELLPAMRAHGLGLLPYFPLACGLLTGKYRRGEPAPAGSRFTVDSMRKYTDAYLTDANWSKVERLEAFARARGRGLLDLAFSWLAAQPAVASVIAGATTPEQVAANAAAAGWTLSPDELAEVDAITG
ncbi:MAG: aldo/keto reductase, partial [Burkholderiaceae bacterium]|nr:aldo/keto reductase [Burkholderiaceae bacterium]